MPHRLLMQGLRGLPSRKGRRRVLAGELPRTNAAPSMKGRPVKDGDPDSSAAGLRSAAPALNERPSRKGRRRKSKQRPSDSIRPSMKGRPVKDGDRLHTHSAGLQLVPSMKGRPVKDGDPTPSKLSRKCVWTLNERPSRKGRRLTRQQAADWAGCTLNET